MNKEINQEIFDDAVDKGLILNGEDGEQGPQGEQGIQGEKGDKGDMGQKGDKGERGEKGDKGEPGKDGGDGKDGIDGTNGVSPILPEDIELLKKIPEIERIAKNAAVGNGVATTSFFNGLRAKNLNIIGGTATQSGDTVNVTVSSGGGGSSPLTTKGDIFGFSTTNARIPVGTNGQVLSACSTAALGVCWETLSSGGSSCGPAGATQFSNGSGAFSCLCGSSASAYGTVCYGYRNILPADPASCCNVVGMGLCNTGSCCLSNVTAMGQCNVVGDQNSIAIGNKNTACYGGGLAIGRCNYAVGGYGAAVGLHNCSNNGYSAAFGVGMCADETSSAIFGFTCNPSPTNCNGAGISVDQGNVKFWCNNTIIGDFIFGNDVCGYGPFYTGSAQYALSAVNAQNAGGATFAGYASSAGSAGSASFAGYANTAGSASNAGYASNAGSASNAGFATNSNYSSCSNYACCAGTVVSDRNKKENVSPISPQHILGKIDKLQIAGWNYKGQTAPHIGPFAQDFRSLFGLGKSSKEIAIVDLAGVALAGIKALSKRVKWLVVWLALVSVGLLTVAYKVFK